MQLFDSRRANSFRKMQVNDINKDGYNFSSSKTPHGGIIVKSFLLIAFFSFFRIHDY